MKNSNMCGKLYIVPTPIGNLKDMTLRAINVLHEVDLIAAEDTRNSIKLLNYFGIKTPMSSYHEFNKISKGYKLIEYILNGKSIAFISDAGMPGISDPGEELINMAYESKIHVEVLPGASAVITALVLSGKSTKRFAFEAFLPKNKKKHSIALSRIYLETRTIVLYESPYHLKDTLNELCNTLGDNRKISICRELTKKHEECIRTTLLDAIKYYKTIEPKGEFVLVIEGKPIDKIKSEDSEIWSKLTIKEHVMRYVLKGLNKKEAIKVVARERGVPKRNVYSEFII